MAASLHLFERSKRQFEAEAYAVADNSSQEIADAEVSCGLAKLFIRSVRDIADGIAWRALGYDRASIKLLALKAQTGYLDWEGTIGELNIAAAHVEATHGIAIINDLTHSLRYGDITVVGEDGIEIVEVKAGHGSSHSGRAARQRRALTTVIEKLNREEWTTDEGIAKIHRLRTKPVAHLRELDSLIAQAKGEGVAFARLSDCIAVDVWHMPTLVKTATSDVVDFHDPFSQSTEAGTHERMRYFDKFSVNLAPYSIYPLKDADCVDLMTGAVMVWVHFNHGNLRRCLRRKGMLVRMPTDDEMESFAALSLPERRARANDVAIRVSRVRQPNELLIELGALGRVMFEWLDEECFAAVIAELLDESGSTVEPVLYLDAFEDEQELWD